MDLRSIARAMPDPILASTRVKALAPNGDELRWWLGAVAIHLTLLALFYVPGAKPGHRRRRPCTYAPPRPWPKRVPFRARFLLAPCLRLVSGAARGGGWRLPLAGAGGADRTLAGGRLAVARSRRLVAGRSVGCRRQRLAGRRLSTVGRLRALPLARDPASGVDAGRRMGLGASRSATGRQRSSAALSWRSACRRRCCCCRSSCRLLSACGGCGRPDRRLPALIVVAATLLLGVCCRP